MQTNPILFCFIALIYEWSEKDRKKVETSLRKKLKRRNWMYNQTLIDQLRILRNELFTEINLSRNSKYFTGSFGKHADIGDFDIDAMYQTYVKKYPEFNKDILMRIIEAAVYFFYVR